MELVNFQITNFRSITDSGLISTTKTTAIVGRNESGKSNLLLALQCLNPPGGVKALAPIKDFPRHRPLQECSETTQVVNTTWNLTDAEAIEVAATWPRAAATKQVTIARDYKGTQYVGFLNVPPESFAPHAANSVWPQIKSAADHLAQETADAQRKSTLEAAISATDKAIAASLSIPEYATGLNGAVKSLASALLAAAAVLPDTERLALADLEGKTRQASEDEACHAKARSLMVGKLPTFVFLDEYPDFDGHQDIASYIQRKATNTLTPPDRNFEKLCKVAGLNAQQLNDLMTKGDHETRSQLANRAGAIVTSELRRLWKDRSLKVRFNTDAQYVDILISDPNAIYDVEVNLDERSRGLRWFFSFFVTFAADTKGGGAEHAILLLDEPGLYLHAASQADLLRYLRNDLKNQVIYTTHSPFMVPVDELPSIRTVQIDQDAGTTVSDNPTGDARTLFPLQAALGFDLAQSLFVGPKNIVVEGVTDYWYLSSVAEYLRSLSRQGLPADLVITPAGGAQKVGYMVALLASQRLKVLVLLDREPQSERTFEELTKSALIRADVMLYVTSGFHGTVPPEADVEDILDPSTFNALVEDTYAKELSGRALTLNSNIPRIVKRYEQGFAALGLEFHKSRPAREFLARMGKDPSSVLSPASQARFEALFGEISRRLQKLLDRDAPPFR